jgi:hypothetical protein
MLHHRYLLALAMGILAMSCEGRPPRVFELSKGFRGWAIVRYEGAGCREIQSDGRALVIRIAESGQVCTSSAIDERWGRSEFSFSGAPEAPIPADPSRSDCQVWGFQTGAAQNAGKPPFKYQAFFVGTRAEWETAGHELQARLDQL